MSPGRTQPLKGKAPRDRNKDTSWRKVRSDFITRSTGEKQKGWRPMTIREYIEELKDALGECERALSLIQGDREPGAMQTWEIDHRISRARRLAYSKTPTFEEPAS